MEREDGTNVTQNVDSNGLEGERVLYSKFGTDLPLEIFKEIGCSNFNAQIMRNILANITDEDNQLIKPAVNGT